MRKTKEFYTEKVELAKKLFEDGMSIRDVAKELGVSYSAAYHWIKGLRTPKASRLEEFRNFIKVRGPVPICDVKNKFPKHNDLYNLSSTRGIKINRLVIEKNFRGGMDYGTWYFLPGQEDELAKRVEKLLKNYKLAKETILKILEEISIKDLNINKNK